MFTPTRVVDVELSHPLETITGLDGYGAVQILVRIHGSPIGTLKLPVIDGSCTAAALGHAILQEHSSALIEHLVNDGLTNPLPPDGLCIADLLRAPHPVYSGELPLVTVAVCTRDRKDDLAICLRSLENLDYPHLDLLVIDNAPSTDATERLVRERYPQVRYVREPRPGLDWARNRAILAARGTIVAYTDDDVVLDPGWARALAELFAGHPEVMAATGLVVPYELETEPQALFEQYGGFGRGFRRRWHRKSPSSKGPVGRRFGGAGQFGTGANMAYRRSLFDRIGLFDPALDVGTVTNGGGDLEMFFRMLKEGHTLVYEPKAIVRHRHRRDYARLKSQLTNNGIGLSAHFARCARAYPDERWTFFRFGLWWLKYWSIRRLWNSLFLPNAFPRELIWAELRGSLVGLFRYGKAQRIAVEIADTYGALQSPEISSEIHLQAQSQRHPTAIAVRNIDLQEPLPTLDDILDYNQTRLFVRLGAGLLGSVDIANQGLPLRPDRLREAIARALALRLIDPAKDLTNRIEWGRAMTENGQYLFAAERHLAGVPRAGLPTDVSVSVVVATLDRPDDLRNCLQHLVAQASPRIIEVVVVDNNPDSGLTPAVVAQFPGVKLIKETRKGLAYARNAGFLASTGEIFLTTDDDVTVPADWVEKLIAPFTHPDVMIVTGNVLPLELESSAQRLFEMYGGLGRGFKTRQVDKDWFYSSRRRAVRTWELGATANAAFRETLFRHPAVDLMDEALGPGMPSGVGEDTYLFYKVLRAGFTIVYESDCYVWHRHRADMKALRLQIYNYSKGHVAYHLTTWMRDGDYRALFHLLVDLPRFRLKQIKNLVLGKSQYPLSLILLEIGGNLAGPWALWRSRRRVAREGKSGPYSPVAQRLATDATWTGERSDPPGQK